MNHLQAHRRTTAPLTVEEDSMTSTFRADRRAVRIEAYDAWILANSRVTQLRRQLALLEAEAEAARRALIVTLAEDQ